MLIILIHNINYKEFQTLEFLEGTSHLPWIPSAPPLWRRTPQVENPWLRETLYYALAVHHDTFYSRIDCVKKEGD
jgi:hypothetical protein